MSTNSIDKLFDLQIQIFHQQVLPSVFIETVEKCIEEGLALNLTIFTKLLECWPGLDVSHIEDAFVTLRKASNTTIALNPEAALTYFKAAQECVRHIAADRSVKKAA